MITFVQLSFALIGKASHFYRLTLCRSSLPFGLLSWAWMDVNKANMDGAVTKVAQSISLLLPTVFLFSRYAFSSTFYHPFLP
jgi:hypothetical protein